MKTATNKKETDYIRRQLTLFLEDSFDKIEKIRQKYNPEQFDLIKAHVTLCQEDEIENLEQVFKNLSSLNKPKITIQFEKPVRFENGKGVFLKASAGLTEFKNLRKEILRNIIENPRQKVPHITLMHPRNSTCNDEIFEQINREVFPSIITFNKISLIEKRNSEKWKVIKDFSLTEKT
jgi:2'-5' RNA ligase